MDKISIIIPVYNVEPYLVRCLDSVIKQTYENLEILLINDGSTDNGGNICDKYAAEDNRIRVFHKKNGGLSTALNVGLKKVTGEYIGFVDSDDWIESTMYEVLYNTLREQNTRLSVGNFYIASDVESTPMKNKSFIQNGLITTKDMLLYPLMRDNYMGFRSNVWNKLYNAKMITSSKLFFNENIKYGMDVLFYYSLILKKKCQGIYADQPLYHYYQRNTAISKSKSLRVRQDILTAYKKVEELMNTYGYSDISFWARGFYCYHASVIAEMGLEINNREAFLKMQDEIATHFDDYVKTNEGYPNKIERVRKLLSKNI